MNPTRIFILVFLMLLGVAFLAYYNYEYKQSPRALPTYGNPGHKVGAFKFVNQVGDTITDKDVAGKIRVIEYCFTTCKGICPKMTDNMTKVYKTFRGDMDVLILTHTVDPETDTVEQLKRYADKHEADVSQWHFLTGNRKELYDMGLNSYLITAVATEDYTIKVTPDFVHTQYFVLVDRYDHIRGAYDGTDTEKVDKLIDDIKELKREKPGTTPIKEE